MEGIAFTVSIISTCIDLAKSINDLVQKFKHARAEFQEGLRIVASTRRLLIEFHEMFETSCLPREILERYSDDLGPLQTELETIQNFLNLYLPLCSRSGLAGIAWRYRWGKEIERHQTNLVQLNCHLNSTITTLGFKVGFLTLEAIHVGYPTKKNLGSLRPVSERTYTGELVTYDSEDYPPRYSVSGSHSSRSGLRGSVSSGYRFSKLSTKGMLNTAAIEETLFAIGRRYLDAARDLRSKEYQYEPPITQIQHTYGKAAKMLQLEEWSSNFCSSQISLVIGG